MMTSNRLGPNTTARAKPAPDRLLPGFQLLKLSPPGPGLMNPEMARASTMDISAKPRKTSTRTDSASPRQARNATNGAPTITHSHHRYGALIPYCAFSSCCSRNPRYA